MPRITFSTAKSLKEQQKEDPIKILMEEVRELREKMNRIEGLLVQLVERLDSLETQVSKESSRRSRSTTRRGAVIEIVTRESRERKHRKRAIDILNEHGVIFESDLRSITNKDAFFAKLKKDGAVVVEGIRERVAISREFLEQFVKELEKLRGPAEAEEKLDGKMRRLYTFLRESGYLTYSPKDGWLLSL